jgi:WD40 repeat protein
MRRVASFRDNDPWLTPQPGITGVLHKPPGLIAFQQYRNAIRQRDNAIFNQIAAQADRLRSTDVSLAAQLDLTAYRMRQTPDLYTTLITAGSTALSAPLTGHTDRVTTVVFSPDGRTLTSGSDDQAVRLWNVTDPGHPTPWGQPLTGHTDTVRSVTFSPDGHTLATASLDKTVRLWGTNVNQAIQRICATTRNTLTPAKWEQDVSSDLPYSPPCQTS